MSRSKQGIVGSILAIVNDKFFHFKKYFNQQCTSDHAIVRDAPVQPKSYCQIEKLFSSD
jgi:hypothetical protein